MARSVARPLWVSASSRRPPWSRARRERVWLAHALTLSRIPLAVGLWWLWGEPAWSAALVVAAAVTDVADGRVARRARRRGATGPDIGGWLDPAADKLFVAIVLAAIWTHTHDL